MGRNMALPLVLTVQETAIQLRLSLNSTYDAIKRGDIPSVKIGRRIVVPRAALERLLEQAGTEQVPE